MPVSHGDKLRNLRVGIADMENIALSVGWFESDRYDDDTPVAAIAAQNEFGNPNKSIPPRPFFRPTISENRSDWARLAGQGARAVMLGNETGDSVAEKMGQLISGQVREKIGALKEPELSPITLALRAYRNKNPNHNIGRTFIRKVAGAIAAGQTGSGQLGDQTFRNTNPLDDSGYMLATLTYATLATQPDLFK